jgi:hypothetical protein
MARRTDALVQADEAINPGSVATVNAVDGNVVAAKGARVEITLTNDHATNVIYLSLGGTAVVGQGIRLNAAGGSYTTSAYTGAVNAIATGASTPLLIVEV